MDLNNIDPEINYIIQDLPCAYYNLENVADCFNNVNSFKCISFNVRSISNKLDMLMLTLEVISINFSIIILTETWLRDIGDFPGIAGYRSYHCIRKDRVGGGVSILVHDSIESQLVGETVNDVWESISVLVYLGGTKFNISGVYRPPSSSINDFNLSFYNYIEQLPHHSSLFVVGDLNVNIVGDNLSQSNIDFTNEFRSRHFIPLISLPTRVTESSASCLDHIWTNSLLPHKAGVVLSDISDHYATVFDIPSVSHNNGSRSVNITFRDVSTHNIEKLLLELKINFNNFCSDFASLNVNDKCDLFVRLFYNIYDKACPIKNKQVTVGNYLRPWMTDQLLLAVKRKNILFRLSRRDADLINAYKTSRNHLGTLIKHAKTSYYRKKFDACSNSSRDTWKLINNIIKPVISRSSELKLEVDGEVTSDPSLVANLFNDYFINVGPSLANAISPVNIDPLSFVNRLANSFVFEPTCASEVMKIIMKFKSKQCNTTDVPNFIYKYAIEILSPIIAQLVNESVAVGCFPSCLKHATVIPIYKKGQKYSISNYRPISTLSFLSKIFERVIYSRLINFFDKYEVIVPHQYGFRPGKSTCDPILRFTDNVYSALNSGNSAMAVFLDFSRAFDTVNHAILLDKLECSGVRGKVLMWFRTYLTGRSQAVRVADSVSRRVDISTGVPQGSILGPLLFNLYINDMCKSSSLLSFLHYADDTTILLTGSNLNSLATSMTAELSLLDVWLRANILSLNISKTNLMIFSNRRYDDLPNVMLNNSTIARVDRVQVLGIFIDSRLSFVHHFQHVINKCSRTCAIMRKTSNFVPLKNIRQIYLCLVYPYLLYCVELWYKSSRTMLVRLERVQNRCVKICSGDARVGADTYRRLNLLTLDQIYTYSITCRFYKYYILKECNYFYNAFSSLLPQHDHGTRFRINNCFNTPYISVSKIYVSFKFNALKCWNKLPSVIRDSSSLNILKIKLRRYLVCDTLMAN